MALRISFDTLGCRLNQYESEALATQFQAAGYTIVAPSEPADIRVINTCTVTNRAERKSRAHTYRALRSAAVVDREAALVVVTGCSVSGPLRHGDPDTDSAEDAGHRVIYVDNDRKAALPAIVSAALTRTADNITISVGRFDYTPPARLFRTRATLKIQDGCDNRCSYCIIPAVRGPAVSRPSQDVVSEAHALLAAGARELVLTGVNISRYHHAGVHFADLVQRLLQIDRLWRLRISSIEPDRETEKLVELSTHPRMARHLHLCLQSASDSVLHAMRRGYRYADFERSVAALRSGDPHFNITTDLIVGFPGETDADAAASLEAVDRLGFGHVHTFPFSPRHGTRAAKLSDQVDEQTVADRARQVRAAAERAQQTYRDSLVGLEQQVLIERTDGTHTWHAHGLGEHYVPIAVRGNGTPPAVNEFVTVRITGVDDHGCTAEPSA